jgi:flagellar basal body-associated protein FliL
MKTHPNTDLDKIVKILIIVAIVVLCINVAIYAFYGLY